jgi:CDP-glucose 4,6-dehydratase
MKLAEASWSDASLAGAYNFGPELSGTASVRDVVELSRKFFGSGKISYGKENEGPHEAGLLTLDVAKSRKVLNFKPRWSLSRSIERTIRWYLAFYSGSDAKTLCDTDIDIYEEQE